MVRAVSFWVQGKQIDLSTARGFAQGSSYQLQEAKTRQEVKSLQARMQGSYHSGSYRMSVGRGP